MKAKESWKKQVLKAEAQAECARLSAQRAALAEESDELGKREASADAAIDAIDEYEANLRRAAAWAAHAVHQEGRH